MDRFYDILKKLESIVGRKRKLKGCNGRMDWPRRGVYFFFEADERRNSRNTLRITRVGTHAVSEGSQTTLWNRLRTHRGPLSGKYSGGGNHRGSIFRLRVGEAIINKDDLQDKYPNWGKGSSAKPEIRKQELVMEERVSKYIRNLPFLWLRVNDKPDPNSDRAYIERNSIALLSNFKRQPIDKREENWLGNDSPKKEIRKSGLWNVDHVEGSYENAFLDKMNKMAENMK